MYQAADTISAEPANALPISTDLRLAIDKQMTCADDM
jgi:hypothetical protein